MNNTLILEQKNEPKIRHFQGKTLIDFRYFVPSPRDLDEIEVLELENKRFLIKALASRPCAVTWRKETGRWTAWVEDANYSPGSG